MARIFEDDVILSGWARLIAAQSNGTETVLIDGDGVATPTGAASVTTLAASGATTLSSTLAVTGNVAVNTNKFTVTAASGNTAVAGTLAVTWASTLTWAVWCAASITLWAWADLIGSSTSDITINTNKFTVAWATGNTVIAGTLWVTGNATLSGKIINAGITSTSWAGAVAITGSVHEVTTTGTGDALTLADGTAGQRLSIIYVAEGAWADTAVITPTTLAGGTTITLNALWDSCDLVYSATGGRYVLGLGGTAAVA